MHIAMLNKQIAFYFIKISQIELVLCNFEYYRSEAFRESYSLHVFSSPEHEAIVVSGCPSSIVRRPSCVNI